MSWLRLSHTSLARHGCFRYLRHCIIIIVDVWSSYHHRYYRHQYLRASSSASKEVGWKSSHSCLWLAVVMFDAHRRVPSRDYTSMHTCTTPKHIPVRLRVVAREQIHTDEMVGFGNRDFVAVRHSCLQHAVASGIHGDVAWPQRSLRVLLSHAGAKVTEARSKSRCRQIKAKEHAQYSSTVAHRRAIKPGAASILGGHSMSDLRQPHRAVFQRREHSSGHLRMYSGSRVYRGKTTEKEDYEVRGSDPSGLNNLTINSCITELNYQSVVHHSRGAREESARQQLPRLRAAMLVEIARWRGRCC